ncbi:MAG: inner membrane protein [Sphingomonadales bacterium]|nr:inner membrane protein [Sphingomonadales bacterium]
MTPVEPHWLWLIAAAALGIAELIAPGLFLIWIAAAAAGTGLLTMVFGVAIAFQFVLFALLAIACVYAGRRWYAAHPVATADPLLNDRGARLIGRTVTVVAPIAHGEGRVKVGDGVWNCRGPDSEAGTRVRIVGAQGTCLLVEPESLAAPEAQRLLPEGE